MLNSIQNVAILTIAQKEELSGQLYAPDSYFWPLLDANSNWTITNIEIDNCVNPQYIWVKDLPRSPYNPYVGPTAS